MDERTVEVVVDIALLPPLFEDPVTTEDEAGAVAAAAAAAAARRDRSPGFMDAGEG